MSVQVTTVEFEQRDVYLSSELDDGPPYTVHGVALGAGDVTVGQSGIKKVWPADELERAAATLEGRSLVVDHENDSFGVVGEVTKAGYKESVGIIYEAELMEEDLAEKISSGLLDVSIRGKHIDVDQMEENDDGAKVVKDITFDNLSIVPTGAAPSNTIEMGEADELSVAELATFAETIQDSDNSAEELAPIEPGMWVKSDDVRGITISQVEGGEVEVDVYEQHNEKWRSTGETRMMSVDLLSEWDVDESEDIGARREESDNEETAEIPDRLFFDSEDEAIEFIEDEDGLTGVHEMDQGWVPGDDHEEFLEWWDNQSSQGAHGDDEEDDDEEMSASVDSLASVDDKVMWEASGGTAMGIVVDRKTDGCFNEQIDGDVEVCADKDDAVLLIETVDESDDGMERTGTMVAHKESTVSSADFEMSELAQTFDDYPEAARENAQMALDAREETDNPNDCGTAAGWKRANQLASGESLSMSTVKRMSQFNRHRQNSEMDDDEGKADCGWMMWKAWGGDEGVDWAQRTVEQEELQPLEVHTPEYSGTTESSWSKPDMEDFDTDDLSEIDDYFLVSKTGFPPENFTDLALPVVEPNGDLNRNALQNAKARASQVKGLSGDNLNRATSRINTLANENFDAMFSEQESAADSGDTESDDGLPSLDAASVSVQTGDDLRQTRKSRESILDNLTIQNTNMTSEIEQKLAELEEPVAVEQDDLEELRNKADRFEEMSDTLESLKERTDILDEVERDQVEALAEADQPTVVESTEHESLQKEAEQVKSVYASALAEEIDVLDAEELTDRFEIEELREKYEEHIGDLEEELSAEPRSGDPDGEELEGQDGGTDPSESKEAEQMREELREKIL